jgi:hypothetical protein
MDKAEPPIQLPLTKEQQELIHKVTGEHAHMLEILPDPNDTVSGSGRGLSFKWRLSINSGIPRQQWGSDGTASKGAADDGAA